MNWTERTFLALVLLVGAGVILVTLGALGVPVPFLADRANERADESDGAREDVPPPVLRPEEDEGLLAELEGGPGGRMRGLEAPGVAPSVERAAAADSAGAPRGETEAGEVAAGEKTRDPLVDQLKAKVDPKDPGQVLGFLMAMTTPKGTKLSEEDLEFLFAALGEHEDYGVRNLLLMHLERVGGEQVTQGVLKFLEDEKNPAAIQRALATLRVQNDDAAVNGLVAYMENAKNRRLREAAFQNLLRTRNGSATDALLDLLDHTQDRSLKRYALAAASQLGGEAGAQAVLGFAGSSDPFERSIGMKGLKDIRSAEAVPALTAAASGGSDNYLRSQAMRALGRIRDPGAIDGVSLVAASDPNRGLRNEAIRTLGSIGYADALPTLREIAGNDSSAYLRRSAEKAIVSIERQEARRAARKR